MMPLPLHSEIREEPVHQKKELHKKELIPLIHFNVPHRKVALWNPKFESLNSMPIYLIKSPPMSYPEGLKEARIRWMYTE